MPLIRWLLNVQYLWNSPNEFTEALQRLPEPTHSHILKFHRLSDRKLALGSQILQHFLVSRFREIPFSQFRITKHHAGVDGGRPLFAGNPTEGTEGLEYNVSHHGSVVAILSRLLPPLDLHDKDVGGGVGVDVLQYELLPAYVEGTVDGVMEWAEGFGEGGVFTEGEMRQVRKAAVATTATKTVEMQVKEVVKALHVNWALKEAYVKAVGTGLVNDLEAVEIDTENVMEMLDRGVNTDQVGLWLGKGDGKRKCEEWYFEISKVQVPGTEGAEGVYCIAMATNTAGLAEEEKNRDWQWLDWGDIKSEIS